MTAHETEIGFEQPRSGFGAWLGILLLFFVFALFVWAVFGIMPHGDNYEQKRAEARMEKLKTVREEANKALAGYGWVDKSKGLVRLPIERAKEVALADLANKKPAVAYPIPAETPAEGAQVTAPTAPAPAATTTSPSPAGSLPKATSIEGKDSENRGQAAGTANPPNAAPASQPGASATPAASPPAPASQARPNPAAPTVTPVQSPAGTPIPIPGKTP